MPRRSARTHTRPRNPEEGTRPLIDRGSITDRARQAPEEVPDSETSDREQATMSGPPPSSSSNPDVIDISDTEDAAPAQKPFVENDVVDYATTDVALEDLLHQAAAFGGVFAPPAIEVDPPFDPSATPAPQTNEDDAGGRTQRSGSPETLGGYMADVIMTGEEPVATYERQDQVFFNAVPSVPLVVQAPSQSSHPLSSNVLQLYLDAVVDKKYVRAYEDHALCRSLVEKAFATMIFSRIVEDVCSRVGVHFTGQSLAYKVQTMNGPDVSLEDIIKFFGEKTPPGFPGSVTSPATFKNHRTCYMRVQSCVRVQEIRRANLSPDERAFLELLEKLLGTEYSQLGSLQASQYGRLKDFQERVNALSSKLYPKLAQQQGAEA